MIHIIYKGRGRGKEGRDKMGRVNREADGEERKEREGKQEQCIILFPDS